MEEICDQTRGQTVANVEQILQELRALNPDAQIILVGYYNPVPLLPAPANPCPSCPPTADTSAC